MTTLAEAGPTRTCVGCGSRDVQASMIRLRLADGDDAVSAIVLASRRPSGRSAYVHDRAECVAALDRTRGLAKSLRAAVTKEMRTDLIELLARPAHEPGSRAH